MRMNEHRPWEATKAVEEYLFDIDANHWEESRGILNTYKAHKNELTSDIIIAHSEPWNFS